MRTPRLLAIFSMPNEYAVVVPLLESNDIPCFVKDELAVQVNNFFSNALGGIRLEVELEDYDEAKSILLENGYGKYLAENEQEEDDDVKNQIIGSLKWVVKGIVILSMALIIYVIIKLLKP